MYLLNLNHISIFVIYIYNLHSTMYLLNHEGFTVWITPMEFTFHYESIKSIVLTALLLLNLYLHSTMYLLNLLFLNMLPLDVVNLHSTMYLLNPRIATPYHFSSLFSVFLSTYHHTMLNHMYTSPAFFILRINTRLSMSL